jgi:two-component system response regulator FixJ
MPVQPRQLTIHVVDDDPDVLSSLRFLLETEGFDVRTFRSGDALLRSVDSMHVDCFVIDYKMAGMNGLDLASRLHERRIEAPIILITGYPDENIVAKAAAAGAREVLLKPHLEESLVAHVRMATQGEAPSQP